MSQPAPSPSGPPPQLEQRRVHTSVLAVGVGSLVFLGFVGYGMLAPTTFRATATLVLTPIAGKPLLLPSSPAPLVRLREAAIDKDTLERTANELKLGAGPAAEAAARARIDAALSVQSPRPDTFEFAFRDATAAGSKRVADLLVRHAAERATSVLGPPAADAVLAREAARNQSAAELAAFLSQHPELSPSPIVAPVAPKDTPDRDPAALRAERDQIQAKLLRMPEGASGSDNPFGEATQTGAEATRMRRRMAEIDGTLKARQKAERKIDTTTKPSAEVERKWKQLMDALVHPVVPADAAAAEPAFTVRFAEARLPSSPIDPDRRAVGLFGAIAALLAAVVVSIGRALFGRPRQGTTEDASSYSEPPRPLSEPPRPLSEPPRPLSEPPRPPSEPPRPPSDPPPVPETMALAPTQAAPLGQPIVQISGTLPSSAEARRSSSNPPAKPSSNPPAKPSSNPPAKPSSNPPAKLSSNPPAKPSSNPPAKPSSNPLPGAVDTSNLFSAAGDGVPSSSTPPRTAVGLAPPSPPPAPAPDPAPSRKPAKPLNATLVGMSPVDPRALDSAQAPKPPKEPPAGSADHEPFPAAPSTRDPSVARATLRPPPADAPREGEPGPIAAEVVDAREPAPPEDSWSGPSRAHRRSVTARRTTQMLGSPIPPVMRGSRPPPGSASTPPVPGTPTPTRYSYVSTRPEEPTRRVPTDTPAYYEMPRTEGETPGHTQTETPRSPAPVAPTPVARIATRPVREGWTPNRSLDFRTRRELSDQLFPLAVEGCFVVGITAVDEARSQKSRVAAELAMALAEPRHPRVLLLEADFQWPEVHRTMLIEMPMALGFSQQLSPKVDGRATAWTVIECSPTLHVLAEGIMRSPGLILSVRFEESIKSLRTYYDLIVIDGPPASAEVDCRALASVVDGAIVVSPRTGSPDLGRACAAFGEKRFSTVVGV